MHYKNVKGLHEQYLKWWNRAPDAAMVKHQSFCCCKQESESRLARNM